VGLLRGGDTITKNGVTVEVIRTPGHTLGSLSFYFRDSRVLFIGDYDLTYFGPYYGDRTSSISDTLASLELLRNIPARVVITSHGKGVFENPDAEIWDRYRDVIFIRENKLLEFSYTPRSIEEIVDEHIIYDTTKASYEEKIWFEIGERMLMKKHLEYLLEKNQITFSDGVYIKL
jgi:hydroxyacylglutathione hydrolase